MWETVLSSMTMLSENKKETEGDKEVLIWWPRGTVRGCRHRACTKNLMSHMETQATVGRSAATWLLHLSIMLTHSYIIEQMYKK